MFDIELQFDEELQIEDLEIGIEKVYPTLENLTIEPSGEEQSFKSKNHYGYDNVKVNPVKLQNKEITLNKNGIYDIVADDNYTGLSRIEVTLDAIEDLEEELNTYNEELTEQETTVSELVDLLKAKGLYQEKLYTGSYDRDGLKQLGWTDEEIDYYNEYGVNWDKEDNEEYALTEKDFGVEDRYTVRFLSKSSTRKDFNYCYELIGIPKIDLGSKTSATSMFSGCKKITTIPLLDTSKITNMSMMFQSCYSLQHIPQLDTSKVTTMKNMFKECFMLSKVPQIDTSQVTDMSEMFYDCSNLTEFPKLDTSNATIMNNTFYGCDFEEVSDIDVKNATDLRGLFNACYRLKKVKISNTGNATNMSSMFYKCCNLKKAPEMDTSKVTNVNSMLYMCDVLTTIPEYDFGNVINVSSFASYGENLKNYGGFKDLGKAYLPTQSANYNNYTLTIYNQNNPNITYESLMNIINKIYDIASLGVQSQKLVLGSNNLNKLTAEEIAIATAKGWTVS